MKKTRKTKRACAGIDVGSRIGCMSKCHKKHPIELAIAHQGSVAKLAAALGVHVTYIYKMRRERHIPVEQCKAIEVLTGIPRKELRPDIFA